MKYVMLKVKGQVGPDKLVPAIFPNFLSHADVARALVIVLRRQDLEAKPVSAGDYNPILGTCSGFSETLKLSVDPRDARVILAYDYEHGIL